MLEHTKRPAAAKMSNQSRERTSFGAPRLAYPSSSQISLREAGAGSTANQNPVIVLETYVRDILTNGGYLNHIEMLDALARPIPNLQKMPEYQNISTLNRVVDNAIACYWHVRSVRVYKELEEFVVDRAASYRHIFPPPAHFEEFGLGNLFHHPTVRELFQLRRGDTTADLISTRTVDILEFMFEFQHNHQHFRPADNGAKAQFRAHLRDNFGGRPLVGVDIDLTSLYATIAKASADWNGNLTAAKRHSNESFQRVLSEAVESFTTQRGGSTVMTQALLRAAGDPVGARVPVHFLLSIGVDTHSLLASLQSMRVHNAKWHPNCSFDEVTRSLWKNTNTTPPHLGLRVMAVLSSHGWAAVTPDQLIRTCFNQPKCGIREVLLVSSITKQSKKFISSCVLGLLVYLLSRGIHTATVDLTRTSHIQEVSSESDVSTLTSNPHEHSLDKTLRAFFTARLVFDIPQASISAVRQFLSDIVGLECFELVLDLKRNVGNGQLNWYEIEQRLDAILAGEERTISVSLTQVPQAGNRKQLQSLQSPGRRALNKATYVAIVTCCIIYHRILNAELAADTAPASSSLNQSTGVLSRETVLKLVTLHVRAILDTEDKLSELVELSNNADPVSAMLAVFTDAEHSITDLFRIPAFECAHLGGSFLQFLSSSLAVDEIGPDCEAARLRDVLYELSDHLWDPESESESSRCCSGDRDPDSGCSQVYEGRSEGAAMDVDESGDHAHTTEELFSAVSKHLSAVLCSGEFHQSDTDSPLNTSSASAACRVTQLLCDAEHRVREEEGFWADPAGQKSFLGVISSLMESDGEVAERVQQLLGCGDIFQSGSSDGAKAKSTHQPHVSPELSLEAIHHHLHQAEDPSSCPRSFESLQACRDHCTEVLVAALSVPLDAARHLAREAVERLKAEGVVCFNESRGGVEVRTPAGARASDVLVFQGLAMGRGGVGCDVDTLDALPAALTANVLELLLLTPLGTSCVEFTLWAEEVSSGLSIVDFVLQHQSQLQARLEDSVFHVIPSANDCVLVPKISSAVQVTERLTQALKTRDFATAASFCLAAALGLVDENAVFSAVNAFFLQNYESLGADAMAKLSEVSLLLTSALPRTFKTGHTAVMGLCLRALSAAGKIQLDTAQHCVWQVALQSDDCKLSHVRLLVSIGLRAGKEFPVLQECAREWSASGAGVVHRARAEAERKKAALRSAPSDLSGEITQLKDASKTDSHPFEVDEADDEVVQSGEGTEQALVKVPAVAHSEQKAFMLDLLQKKYHYTQGGLVRPAVESPEVRQLQQAINLLSATLYSSQVHFVMELIQNADDNSYAPGVTPTIRLELFPHAVVVYNNECGFSDKNIEAVCNVGGSTKANKTGYIGQKGIGFKSVFAISDAPEIHSCGYHIAFKREVSMLEPRWLDPTAESQWPSQHDSGGTHYETCLRLRLDAAALKNLTKLNQDIQAVFNGKLILFLNKLERMILEDRMRDQVVEHCRTRLSANWMRISVEAAAATATSSPAVLTSGKSASGGSSTLNEVFWLVLRSRFTPTVRRVEVVVAETEVAIAFKFAKSNRGVIPRSVNDADGLLFEKEQIRLDFSEGLMPVYAYLPTSTCCFRFMVQGDFVLPTNRESILEQNEWNLGLLEQVPRVFVGAIVEMAKWCDNSQAASNSKSPADFPILSQLSDTAYSLLIEPADFLHALPRRREATRDYIENVVSRIYQELKAVRCLQSSSGAMCAPSKLVAVHHLDFDPAAFVPEELLLAATGCQYTMHDTGAYELDGDLVADLGVRVFDISCIVDCLKYLATQTSASNNSSSVLTSQVASALLGLGTMTRWLYCRHTNKHMADIAHRLDANTCDLLRRLQIWPTSAGAFVTLDQALIFVQKKKAGTSSFSPQQQECLKVFQDRLLMVDTALLEAAAACVSRGADLLTNFLVENFRQVRVSAKSAGVGSKPGPGSAAELSAQYSGGVEELTSDIVLKRMILPAYKRFACGQTSDSDALCGSDASVCTACTAMSSVSVPPPLDRHTAAAFLAFFCLSLWGSRVSLQIGSEYLRFVQEVGVVVPVLTATSTEYGTQWVSGGLKVVKFCDLGSSSASSVPEEEVHLGFEFADSASSVLGGASGSFTMRQLSWQVVDPLAACLLVGDKASLDQNQHSYVASGVATAFRAAQEELKKWREFMLRIGVLNLFGLYRTAQGQFQAPHLIRVLDALLSDSVEVTTNQQNLTESREYLPVFLSNGSGAGTLHRVSNATYDLLLHIAEQICAEVLQVRATRAAASVKTGGSFLTDLHQRCWLPIAVHGRLQESATHSHYVCAPCHAITCHGEKASSVVWSFGPHFAYLPYSLSSNPSFRSLFQFRHISSRDPPSHEFMMGYLKWSSEQADVPLFNNVSFMRWFYTELQAAVMGGESVHSSVVALQLSALLQNDAPVVWIPDQVPSLDAATDPYKEEDTRAYYSGRMVPLSHLVKHDPSQLLHFSESPVKSLALFYTDNAALGLFSRKRYCKVCQAVEGMFGVTGGQHARAGLQGHQCTCVSDCALPVAVRDTPSAMDLVHVLEHHVSQHLMNAIDDVLTALSVNVWKGFQVRHGLRPYSSQQLRHMQMYFRENDLLPTTHGEFVAAHDPHKIQVIVDDREAFDMFATHLSALRTRVDWLHIGFVDGDEPTSVVHTVEEIEKLEEELLRISPADFATACDDAPQQTFLAPPNKLALYEFLGIKKLSDHIQVSWVKVPCAKASKAGPAAQFVSTMNHLLTYAQAHLHHREHKVRASAGAAAQTNPQLNQYNSIEVFNVVAQVGAPGTRVHSLMQVDIVECSVLQRRLSLELGTVSAEIVLEASSHREFGSNTLFLGAHLCTAEARHLAVSTLMKALQADLAPVTPAPVDHDLDALQRKLVMVAERATTPEMLQTILEANDLAPLPHDVTAWCKKERVFVEPVGSVAPEPDFVDSEPDSWDEDAHAASLEAYHKMQADSAAFRSRIVAQSTNRPRGDVGHSSPPVAERARRCSPSVRNGSVTTFPQNIAPCLTPQRLTAVSPLPNYFPSPPPPSFPPPPLASTPLPPPLPPSPAPPLLQQFLPFRPPPPPCPPPTAPTSTHPTPPTPQLSQKHPLSQASYDSDVEVIWSVDRVAGSGRVTDPIVLDDAETTDKAPQKVDANTVSAKRKHWEQNSPAPDSNLNEIYTVRSPPQSLHSKRQRLSMHGPDVMICAPNDGDKYLVQLPAGELSQPALHGAMGSPSIQESELNHRIVSGRIGEELAAKHLRRLLLSRDAPNNLTGPRCTQVRWLNEHAESGLPFDIELAFADGSVKHCEVKTRSVARHHAHAAAHLSSALPSQWLVSPAEVAQAHLEKQAYFCVFVSLCIDYAARKVEELQTKIVGYENGLTEAMRAKDVYLVMEMTAEYG